MALILSKSPQFGDLCSRSWNVLFQQLRYLRPKLKNPPPTHYNRARVMAVCQPIYPPKPKNCEAERIRTLQRAKGNPIEDNPYGLFLAGQLRRDFKAHPLVLIFHYNCYNQRDLLDIKGFLFDIKFPMKIQQEVNSNVVKLSLTSTRWAPLIPLFDSKTAIGWCASENLPLLAKALKKMPQFVLIAAVLNDNILHKDALDSLTKLKDIDNVRGQLCATLANPAVTLSHNLSTNISAFSHTLSTYAKGSDTDSSSSSDSSSDSSSSDSDSDEEKK